MIDPKDVRVSEMRSESLLVTMAVLRQVYQSSGAGYPKGDA